MAEKKKWYDSKKKLSPEKWPEICIAAPVSVQDARKIIDYVETLFERNRIPSTTEQLLVRLCKQPPVARLSRNLRTVVSLLAQEPIDNIMQQGLTKQEALALLDLEHVGAPSEVRALVHGLLNINERQQLVTSLTTIYREERTRKWDLSDE